MAGIQFSDKFAKDEIQVSPVTEVGDELTVLVFHFYPVHAVQIFDVEPIPVNPPSILIDLSPLLKRIDLHRQTG